jgi:hypothetical protein
MAPGCSMTDIVATGAWSRLLSLRRFFYPRPRGGYFYNPFTDPLQQNLREQ